ncbi:ribonuclease P protein subunit p25-like protein [Mizuhopecten yessoensis]|uniref:Ribonuclease P protein subunit p25-like protein n=1 Tax=Mizuhopecten yessoensis TaxID=6573 RepID=A0A210Q7M6_MIZYE|nr:ribonuclease P protein subunit p25-like protein [Mizuhopecten yessoensis]XP_021365067.1 ribonuclease P protein subunit p25-like protein [Mizuhopecten yessoensis]XP_021365069.1 ribonuclease P protein subunit p25-like protein [Mizuhopecten yessoensis]XP_021365070.1 ribonuclease P protein subunit p25-like protein [Mizuhopecten yessoensis]OWF44748.1 Ribonuclease P protein subunit p25-like protein [Mizuhopecten yessoensis]
MENYTKGEVQEVSMAVPFSLDNSGVEMKVSAGSKLRNLLGYSMKKIKEPEVKQMTWNASGPAIPKAISCAEIMKRKNKTLHQITKLVNRRVEEYWEPKVEGLDRLKVNRDIPAISILLSKVPVDTTDPGYQAPGYVDVLWTSSSQQSSTSSRKHGRDSGQQGSATGKRQRKGKNQRDNKNKPGGVGDKT